MKETEATQGEKGVHSLLIEMGVLRKGIRKKVRFDQRPEQTEGTLHVCISGGRAARADQTASTEPLRQGCARLDRERTRKPVWLEQNEPEREKFGEQWRVTMLMPGKG